MTIYRSARDEAITLTANEVADRESGTVDAPGGYFALLVLESVEHAERYLTDTARAVMRAHGVAVASLIGAYVIRERSGVPVSVERYDTAAAARARFESLLEDYDI